MIFRILTPILFLSNLVFCQNYDQKIFPNDPNPGVFFGRFVELNNDNAFISAYQDFENGSSSGALYIYNKSGVSYQQVKKIFPDDGGVEEFFGYSMSSFDDWLITGAHHDSDFGASSGGAYVLLKSENKNWEFYQKLLPFDASEADEFGKTVDIYQDYIVSCSYLDDDSGTNSGSVYIYKWNGQSWEHNDKIHASDPEDYSQFGLALDLFKNQLIIGSPFKNSCGTNCGAAYIYERINGKWTETAKLVPDDLSEKDEFGITTKINNDYAFVSSIKDDDLGENSGSVYIYKKTNNKWNYLQKLTAFDGEAGDAFGIALEINDSLAIIGSYFDDDNGENSGSVYIYKNIDDDWQFIKKITPDDGDESDAFGSSISLNENNVLIGAYSDDDNGFFSGAAYLFSLEKILTNSKDLNLNNIEVFPTIFKNSINVLTEDKSNYSVIDLIDLRGNLVRSSEQTNTKQVNLNTRDIKSGIYFLRVNDRKTIRTFKLIKY